MMGLSRNILLRASTNRWISTHLPRYRFMRRAVKRFVPGETAEEALAEAFRLERDGFTTLLTFLGENVTDAAEASAVTDRYLKLLDLIDERGLDSQISIKLTQLGLDIDHDRCRDNLMLLVLKAADTGSMVWIDMESSACTDVTLDLFRGSLEAHESIGICLQSYLRRTAGDLDTLLHLHPAIRLVKGAYQEPADIAFPSRSDVDANFRDLALRIVEEGAGRGLLALGTHDEGLVDEIVESVGKAGDDGSGLEIQMIHGIGRRAQRRWLSEGLRVRILLCYGDAWYSWFVRRLAERPANIWFVLRNIFTR